MLRTVLQPYVGSPERLLDVGSADGPSVGWLNAGQLASLDLDPRGLRPPSGICGSVLALPFADASFDAVVCCVSVDYLVRPVEVFADVARVLRPGGRYVTTFSNRCFPTKAVAIWNALDGAGHAQLVSMYLKRAGFAGIEVRVLKPEGGSGDPLTAVLGWGAAVR